MSRVDRYEYKDWKNFGMRTSQYRNQVGMSKEKFAETINRSVNFVSDLEKGRTSCSIHTLHQISKALKIPTDSLMYGENTGNFNEYTNKEILLNIIERCDEDQLAILRDLIVATFPNLDKIKMKRSD